MTKHEMDHLDVRRIVVPLWAAATLTLSMIASAVAVVGLYFSVMQKIDTMQANVVSLVAAVERASQTAEAALTGKDLDNWCLKAQITNPGWRCPVVGSDGLIVTTQRMQRITPPRPRPVEAKANSSSGPRISSTKRPACTRRF